MYSKGFNNFGFFMKKAIIIFLSITLSSCVSIANIKDTSTIKDNKGVMLTNFISRWYGYEVRIIKKSNTIVDSAVLTIKKGDNLKVISLSPGEYTWREIKLGRHYAKFRNKFDFEIKENEITYIGDIAIDFNFSTSNLRFGVIDNPETIYIFKEKYPMLSNNYKISKSILSQK